MNLPKNVVLGVTGSIAAAKAVSVAKAMRECGFSIRVAMTHSARQVITPQSMRAVSDAVPFVDMWWPDDEDGGERHVELARWASAIVIAPATASCIACLAHGLYDNCVTLVAGNILPTRWMICPAMAQAMWEQGAVQDNVQRLRSWGANFVGPEKGKVASGEQGQRMSEPDEIAQGLSDWWKKL